MSQWSHEGLGSSMRCRSGFGALWTGSIVRRGFWEQSKNGAAETGEMLAAVAVGRMLLVGRTLLGSEQLLRTQRLLGEWSRL
jgi:hypothetical protein